MECVHGIKLKIFKNFREEGVRGMIKLRKKRKDAKRDIRPTVHADLYECLTHVSYITCTPVKNVGEEIIEKGINNIQVLEYLSKYFQKDYWFNNRLFVGQGELGLERTIRVTGEKKRVAMRFSQEVYDKIAELAYVMGLTVSSATHLILESSIKNSLILHEYVESYIDRTLDENRKKALKDVLKFINDNNPYEEEISLFALLGMIFNELVDDFKSSSHNIKYVIDDYINSLLKK